MDIDEAKRRAKSGPMFLMGRRVASLLIVFLSTVTIARLVSPREYGLANMAALILSFGQMFRDFGLTNALMRKGEISRQEMSLIFWFNTVMTLAVSTIIALLSKQISDFYHEPVVQWVILFALAGFVIEGITLQHRSLLARELRFQKIATVDTAAQLVGFVATLLIAIALRNVWAIVAGQVIQSVTSAICYVSISRWVPGRPRRSPELLELLAFGANTSIFSIALFLSQNAAPIAIGRYLGSTMLGQYNRAQALYLIPSINIVQPIAQAMTPLLMRLRSDPVEYSDAYLSLIRRFCAVLMPLSMILLFAAHPLVIVVLGRRWEEAGRVLAILAPALSAIGIAYSTGDLFITQNRSADLRRLAIFELVLRVGAVLVGVSWGLEAAALAFTVTTVVAAGVRVVVAGRSGPVTLADQLRAAMPGLPGMVGAFLGSGATASLAATMRLAPFASVSAIVLGGGAASLAVSMALRSSRGSLIELADTFQIRRLARVVVRR